MHETMKTLISYSSMDVECTQEALDVLTHIEWFFKFGLRETAKITYPSVLWIKCDI